MRGILLFLLMPLLLISCSGKGGDNKVNFSLTLGNIAGGVPLTGGLYLTGTSSSGLHFSFGTTNPGNVAIDLPNGEWTFQALGWKAGGGSPMDGTNVCGSATANLAGGDAAVNLTLNTGNCNSALFASPEAFDTIANDGTFKELDFESCLTTAYVNTAGGELCNNQTLARMTGQSAAIRIVLRGESNFGSPISNLVSDCFAVTTYPSDLTGSSFNTNLKLPVNVGGSYPFPIEIQGYRDATCGTHAGSEGGTDEAGYVFINGFGGNPGDESHSIVENVGSTLSRVYWPDNYLGYPDSAFVSSSIAPVILCNGLNQCYNGDTSKVHGGNESNIKEGVWGIVGNSKWAGLHDEDPTGTAVATIEHGPDTITVSASNAGVSYQIDFQYDGGQCTGGAVATIDNANNVITVGACNDATTPTIVAAIDALTEVSAGGTGAQTNWDSRGSENTRFPQILLERELGVLTEIKHMLYGPMGAILHKEGVTTLAAVCSDSGSYSETFINEQGNPETFTISLGAGSVTPSDHMVSPNATAYEKRLTFTEPNGSKMVFEFNCSAGGDANGYFRTDRTDDDGEVEQMEIHYYTQDGNKAGVEMVNYDYKNASDVRREWQYFQKVTDTEWRYYETTTSPNNNWYARIGARGDETGDRLDVRQYYSSASATNNVNFTGGPGGGEQNNNVCVQMTNDSNQTCGSPVVEPTAAVGGNIDATDGEDFAAAIMTLDFSTNDLDSKIPANFTGI